MELISQKTGYRLRVPDENLINFKEALIFAFLGFLRVNNMVNVFSSATGCSSDHSAGVIVQSGVH
jgi:anhydro-N-acetylmuramic acid kinase